MSSDPPRTLKIPRAVWSKATAPSTAPSTAPASTAPSPAPASTAFADPAGPLADPASRVSRATSIPSTLASSGAVAATASVPRRNPARATSIKGVNQPSAKGKNPNPERNAANNAAFERAKKGKNSNPERNVGDTAAFERAKKFLLCKFDSDCCLLQGQDLQKFVDDNATSERANQGASQKDALSDNKEKGKNSNPERNVGDTAAFERAKKRDKICKSLLMIMQLQKEQIREVHRRMHFQTIKKRNNVVSCMISISLTFSRAWMHRQKLDKIIMKLKKLRSRRLDKAEADYERTKQNIKAQYKIDLLDAVSEADAPEVALVSHLKMLDHIPPESHSTKENPERVSAIFEMLREQKMIDRCCLFEAPLAKVEDLLLAHSSEHVELVKNLSSTLQGDAKASLYKLKEEKDDDCDMYFSTGTSDAVLMAAGAAMKACELVICGPNSYSFAIVRPPGHHVGIEGPPNGFCFVNNTSIAAKFAQKNYHLKRILIVDWDVHHGNGTQDIFYTDTNVMVVSIHRFQTFFPFNADGGLTYIGDGDGAGYNMNICWAHGNVTDADYNAVWTYLVLPIVQEFDPELVLISSGFDAVEADPLGDCKLSPNGFAHLLRQLMDYPVVMVLEGGYNVTATAKSATECVRTLLGDKCDSLDNTTLPFNTTLSMIRETRKTFQRYWKCFESNVPRTLKGRQYS